LGIETENKKKVKILFIIALLLSSLLFFNTKNAYAGDIVDFYNANGENVVYVSSDYSATYAVKQKAATTSIRYRTIGFQTRIELNGETYYTRIPLSNFTVSSETSGGYVYSMFKLDIRNLVKKYKTDYPSKPAIFDEILSGDDSTTIFLDGIVTIYENGVIKGSLSSDGTESGEVYFTYNGSPLYDTSKVKLPPSKGWSLIGYYDSLRNGIKEARGWDYITANQSLLQVFGKRMIIAVVDKEKIPIQRKVIVEYRDVDTQRMIKTSLKETVETTGSAPIKKSYSAATIAGYDYVSSSIVSGDVLHEGGNPVTISIMPKGVNKVTFYYKQRKVTNTGKIKFDPIETSWTNEGKISEGVGEYPINVSYEGDNPMEDIGYWEGEHDTGEVDEDGKSIIEPCAGTFPVSFELDNINVTGATNEIIDGAEGLVNIDKEGAQLQLKGVGQWKEPIFQAPDCGCSYELPDTPEAPTGESSYYNIDWTKSSIEVTEPIDKWINNPVPYKIDILAKDNLSGFAEGSKVTVNDSSHYKNDKEDNIPEGNLEYNTSLWITDGIYEIDVKADDIAGNEHSESYETYYIDGNSPEVSFNVTNKIFSVENGSVRKSSKKGSDDSYYGTLTASDNLSGVSKIQYKWTYWNNKPDYGYEVIYESPYTYIDRYEEVISEEIEKPVGDNLYLHVEMWDVAGNYTYQSFGPFEDPIMLKNFKVTDIRDPRWKSIFWKDDKYKEYTGKMFKVNELGIDEKSHTTLKNSFPKKGYAFYFDITSEYLYRDNDRIEITPNFYYVKGDKRTRVDCYYDNKNNPLVAFGSKHDDSSINLRTNRYGDVLIGNYNKLILTRGVRIAKGREWKDYDGIKGWKDEIQYTDGKEQWWYGKYFIPSSSFFVKAGDSPRPENRLTGGNILINFEIVAYKKGIETFSTDQIFSYNLSQWELEGGPKNSNYKTGDVIIYNGKYGVDSDHSGRVIH